MNDCAAHSPVRFPLRSSDRLADLVLLADKPTKKLVSLDSALSVTVLIFTQKSVIDHREGPNFSFVEPAWSAAFPLKLANLARQATPRAPNTTRAWAGTHHALRPSFCAWESPSRGVHSPLHSTAARRAYTLPAPSVCTATAPRTTRPTKLSNSDRIVGAMTLAPLKNTQSEPAPTEDTSAVKQ